MSGKLNKVFKIMIVWVNRTILSDLLSLQPVVTQRYLHPPSVFTVVTLQLGKIMFVT